MKLNVNADCYVKLTPAGLERFYKKQRDLGITGNMMRHPDKVDKTNWCRFHIWDLMQTFGDMMFMGATELPFENNSIVFGEQPNDS